MVEYPNILPGDEAYYVFSIVIVLIIILQRLAQIMLNRITERNELPPDLLNGLRVLVRFAFALVVVYAAVIILDIGQSTTISLSLFIGSVVSFASMYTIQNFVAGIYLVITQPFKVNDLVKIGGTEGVVTEISLNYTSILNFEGILEYLPNKKILNSSIINYDQRVDQKVTNVEKLNWLDMLKTQFDDEEITRYTFVWGAPLIDLQEMKKRLDKVCKKYKSIFGYQPTYIPMTINHRFEFYFVLQADEPIIILKNRTDFLDDISAQFH